MICPACKTEYRPGFEQCADCKVPLVETLPQPAPPAADYAEARPEAVRWELNRTDSRNIAFIKGALIGLAVGQVLQVPASLLLRLALTPSGFVTGPATRWIQVVFLLPSLIAPLCLVIGGVWTRSRMR
jgi:hypothetical protein